MFGCQLLLTGRVETGWPVGVGFLPDSLACCMPLRGSVFEGSWSVTFLTTPFLELQRNFSPKELPFRPVASCTRWSAKAVEMFAAATGAVWKGPAMGQCLEQGTQPHTTRMHAEQQHGAAWAIPQALLLDHPCPVAKTVQVSGVFDGRPEQIRWSSEFHFSIWKLLWEERSWLTASLTQWDPSLASSPAFSCLSCVGSLFALSECHSAVLGQRWPTHFRYKIKSEVAVVQRENWNTHEISHVIMTPLLKISNARASELVESICLLPHNGLGHRLWSPTYPPSQICVCKVSRGSSCWEWEALHY